MENRVTGELLPDVAEFVYYELATIGPDWFKRNISVDAREGVKAWRTRYDNRGVFRSVFGSNREDFLQVAKDSQTLYWGDLCFDLDVGKGDSLSEQWGALVEEAEGQLIPALQGDFSIRSEEIRIWFSGSRGLHVEVPGRVLGVWPDHDLHRVFAYLAKDLVQRLGLKFLDQSLYGSKHLYRLEHSIHQKTELYKWPLRVSELRVIKDYEYLSRVAKTPRSGVLWETPTVNPRTLVQYERLYKTALEIKKTVLPTYTPRDRSLYDRSTWKCIETLFSDDHMLAQGYRDSIAFLLASHFHQEGFSFEEAKSEMSNWAEFKCYPPLDEAEWLHKLEREYAGQVDITAGCTYLQQVAGYLCQEDVCVIGKARLARNKL